MRVAAGRHEWRAPRCLLALATIFGTIACAPPIAVSSHDFTLTMEDGVETAFTTGGAKFDGELFRYEKVLELRPDPEVAASIMYAPLWMAMAADGRIFVSDMGDEQVVVFGSSGEYLYRIGREGQGPGEFQNISYVDVVDGVLWVTDGHRNHAFRLDGTLLETATLPLAARSLMRDGRWWRGPGESIVIHNLQRRSGDTEDSRAEMHIVGADGETIVSVATPWVMNAVYLDQQTDGRRMWLNYFFTIRPWGAYSRAAGFFLVNPTEPVVNVYDHKGVLRRRLEVEFPPQRVTDEDRVWAIGQLDNAVRKAEEGTREWDRALARMQRDNPRFADPKHFWGRPIVDDKGFLWLWSRGIDDLPAGSYRFFVFSPEGEYLGKTTTPGWPQLQRGNLLTLVEDRETGERFPTVYRVRPGVEDLEYSP